MFKQFLKLTLFNLILVGSVQAYFPINFFRTYDINFRTERWENEKFKLSTLIEGGLTLQGRNFDGDKVNVLQIWDKDIDALTMLRGFPRDSAIGEFFIDSELSAVNDDGKRGHLLPLGTLDAVGYSLYGQFYLPQNFSFISFLPLYSMKLKNVEFKDLTEGFTDDDIRVKSQLTDNFAKLVKDLGGLSVGPWQQTGLGDLVSFFEWSRNYPQMKRRLKNVHIDVRAGFTAPTGVQKDEDVMFSIPFGNDGSWGLLFGGGLDLRWGSHVQAGVDVEFLQLFGTEKCRRIKTDKDQTDLVLLAKTKVFKEMGFNQRYNIYFEGHNLYKGLSARLAYQYLKRTDERLFINGNDFSSEIANSAVSLEDWTIHEFIFLLKFDFYDICKQSKMVPYLTLFYKLPFNGTRSVAAQTLGLDISFSF